jgi:hypothetical protein
MVQQFNAWVLLVIAGAVTAGLKRIVCPVLFQDTAMVGQTVFK